MMMKTPNFFFLDICIYILNVVEIFFVCLFVSYSEIELNWIEFVVQMLVWFFFSYTNFQLDFFFFFDELDIWFAENKKKEKKNDDTVVRTKCILTFGFCPDDMKCVCVWHVKCQNWKFISSFFMLNKRKKKFFHSKKIAKFGSFLIKMFTSSSSSSWFDVWYAHHYDYHQWMNG